ncbi:lysosomal acid lipase/cholesteryl ester hydrolase-like isoform X2 [Oculina patagonica]
MKTRKEMNQTKITSQLITNRGYPVEEHSVITNDSFVLNIQRIPHGRVERTRTQAGPKPVVFLQHGLLADSSNWVQNYAWDSLGYILADNGFDVWLGNIRGNRYSRRHLHLKPTQKEFWDWSFQEMAHFDIPAMIDHALKVSGQAQLFYIGHSQGTLVGFTSFSTNPEIAKKVKLFIALAPIFYLNHTAEILRDLAFTLYPIEEFLHPLGESEFLPGRVLQKLLDIGFCGGKWSEKACYDIAEIVFGFDDTNSNMSRVPVYISNWPAGTSFKNIIHFGQIIVAGRCQMFDYGRKGNRKHYNNQNLPPVYDVSKMTTPTAFFFGAHDTLSNKTDVEALIPEISHLTFREFIPEWNHIDFVFGMDAAKTLYYKLVEIMEESLMA